MNIDAIAFFASSAVIVIYLGVGAAVRKVKRILWVAKCNRESDELGAMD